MSSQKNGSFDYSRHVGMSEKQRAYWNGEMSQMPPAAELPNGSMLIESDRFPTGKPISRGESDPDRFPTGKVIAGSAQPFSHGENGRENTQSHDAINAQCSVSQPAAIETHAQKTESFSGMSAAFIVLGLLLVGGAISPLLAFFQVVQAARYFIGLAYIVLVTVTVLWLAGKLFARAAKRYRYVLRTRIAVLVVAEMVLLSFTATCHPFEFRWEVTSLVFAVTLLVVQLVPSRATRWNAYTAFSVNEIAIIFILSGIMLTVPFSRFFSATHVNTVSTVCYSAVAAIIAASAFLRARELFPAHPCKNETGNESYATLQSASTAMRFQPLSHPRVRNAALLVMRASVLTVFIAVFVYSFVPFGSSKYALDIVFMGSALACTALGFKAEEPTLRRMGLVFAIASIMKMVLIDTMMYDALEKAVAYIVGGAVCFALGALYNYAVKRLA